jgi:predicted RNA binding protein YcfA (HicA-like mRNA interferase family)
MSGRLPSCTPAAVERALCRAGFTWHHARGSHRYYWHAAKLLMVGVPYHHRDLKRGTLHGIIKQAGLTPEDFVKLLHG